MAHRKNDNRRRVGQSDDTEKGPHRVGYGCPPRETRFKSGQSGNPNGRPRRIPTAHAVLNKVLGGTVELREGERTKRVTKLIAIFETAVNRALKGDPRYLRAILQFLSAKSEDQNEVEANHVASADDEAILADYRARFGASASAPKVDKASHEPSKPLDAPRSTRGKP